MTNKNNQKVSQNNQIKKYNSVHVIAKFAFTPSTSYGTPVSSHN